MTTNTSTNNNNNNKIQFTRYLYLYEEVELSLILTLLKKTNIDKMLFWCYELYYSTHENNIFPLLFKIYFDFYAIKNPKFYDYMVKNYNLWKKDKNCFIVGNICKNLFLFCFDTNVFTLRQFSQTISDVTLYRGRKPIWLAPFDKKYHNLYLSIHKRNYKNICYYIKKLECDAGNKFLCIIDYFEKIENANIIHENIITKLEDYDDFEHYIFFVVILMFEWDSNINVNNKKIYITMNNEEKETTRGFAVKYSHPSLWRCLRALIPRFATCHRADRTPRVLFNSTPSAGALVSALHRAKPHAAEVERLAPHGLFGLTFHVCQQAASRQRTQYIQGKPW